MTKDGEVCSICDRPRLEKAYCPFHNVAHENLERGFKRWKYAYGSVTFTDYLLKILARKETGKWVREIALHEMKEIEPGAKVLSN